MICAPRGRASSQLVLGLLLLCLLRPATGQPGDQLPESWCVAAQGAEGPDTPAAPAGARRWSSCLLDGSVSTILLLGDYDIGNEFAGLARPVAISRNVTVVGLPGGRPPVLDWGADLSVQGALQLCATCVFSFRAVSTRDEARRGRTLLNSLFVGAPGSRLVLSGGFAVATVCPPIGSVLASVTTTPRSSLFPAAVPAASVNMPQQAAATSTTFQGSTLSNTTAALLSDVSADVPLSLVEGGAYVGGYALHLVNRTLVCLHMASPDCLRQRSPEDCVAQEMDQLLLAGKSSSSASSSSRGLPAATAAAIAVPVAVVGAALLSAAVVLLLLVRRRRRSRMQQQKEQLPVVVVGDASKGGGGGAAAGAQPPLVTAAASSGLPSSDDPALVSSATVYDCGCSGPTHDVNEVTVVIDPRSGAAEPDVVHKPLSLGGPRGWQCVSTLTTPTMKHAANSKIELGELLGAGSFARVFRGRWAGLEVAVKVIEHDSDATSVVENEVQLMLSLNNPNIIRAFHSTTFVHQPNKTSHAPAFASPHSCSSSPEQHDEVDENGEVPAVSHSDSILPAARCCTPTGFSWTVFNSDQLPMADQAAAAAQEQQQQEQLGKLRTLLDTPPRPPGHVLPSTSLGDGSVRAQQLLQPSEAQRSPAAAAPLGVAPSPLSPGTASTGFSSLTDDGSLRGTRPAVGDSPLGVRKALRPSARVLRGETMLVLEYADCGTLASVASQCWSPEQEDDVQMLQRLLLLRDCAAGLEVLHSKSIVHGDINAQNVLVCSSRLSECGLTAKLADLGLSRVVKSTTHRTTRTVGTMSHMPPCLLQYGRLSPALDVYSFGVMMWELFTGQVAFQQLHYGQFFETVVLRGLRPEVPAHMPDDYQLLMERCWTSEPGNRPTVRLVLDCLDLMIEDRRKCLQRAGTAGGATQMQPSATPQAAFVEPPVPRPEQNHHQHL